MFLVGAGGSLPLASVNWRIKLTAGARRPHCGRAAAGGLSAAPLGVTLAALAASPLAGVRLISRPINSLHKEGGE